MEFDRYYSLLKVSDGDNILIDSRDSLVIGLYLAGRAKRENKKIIVHALVRQDAAIQSEADAINYASEHLPNAFDDISEGTALVKFSAVSLAIYTSNSIHNKAILEKEEMGDLLQALAKIDSVTMGGKLVLLNLPFKFFGRVRVVKKSFFKEKTEIESFRQFLAGEGFSIGFFDVVESRLFCLVNAKKFDPRANIAFLSFDELGELIHKEIMEYIIYLKADNRIGVESLDKEYIYVVQAEMTHDQPLECDFICLDGRGKWTDTANRENAKHFSIIVLPNVETFRKELESKDILVMSKEKVFELYAENVDY